jgi:hypothetical protein
MRDFTRNIAWFSFRLGLIELFSTVKFTSWIVVLHVRSLVSVSGGAKSFMKPGFNVILILTR